MITRFAILVAVLLLTLPLTASATDYGGYAGAYLQLSVTPRAVGMGNAYTAVSDDISAVFFNPGAVAQLQRLTVGGAYRDMSYGRSLQQLAVLFPVRGEAAIAISAEMASMGDIVGRNSRGEPTGELDNMDAVISITFSRRFSKYVSTGGNARYYYKKLETASANSAGFDFGAMLHLRKDAGLPEKSCVDLLRFAFVVRNISAKFPWRTGEYWGPRGEYGTDVTDKVPVTVKMGTSVLFLKSSLLVAVDGEVDEKRGFKAYTGAEYRIAAPLCVRAGLAHGEPAFGAGIKVPSSKVDAKIDIAVEQARHIGGWESIFGFSVGF